MNKLKAVLTNLFFTVYSFFSGFFIPILLNITFNFTKGICNNPEGVIFIPFGIVALLAILVIDLLIIVKTVKSKNMTVIEKVITITLFAVAKVTGLALNQNEWKIFVQCFKWKYM